MNPTLQKTITKTFIQLLLDLRKEKEIEIFLRDFFTEKEFETYIKRLAIAYWLKKGRDSNNIQNNLKASPKEIKEIKKALNLPGFKLAIKYLEAEEWANIWSERIKNKKTYKDLKLIIAHLSFNLFPFLLLSLFLS